MVFDGWTQTTNTIDYGIKSVVENKSQTVIKINRIGSMPMPLEILVNFKNSPLKFISHSSHEGRERKPLHHELECTKRLALVTEYELIINHPKVKP